MWHDSYVAGQKLSSYVAFQLVVQHHVIACDILTLACDDAAIELLKCIQIHYTDF